MMVSDEIKKAKELIDSSDAVMIGAGAGLSTAAGFTYSGKRFNDYSADMEKLYGFHDMYSRGFYPFPTPEKMWALWSRNIYVNRYMNPPKETYRNLLELVKGKDHFVLTTNVDHCFRKAGFDKNRLFYTQGDYGLFQCSEPCHAKTYDNSETVRRMVLSQSFTIHDDGTLSTLDETPDVKTEIPSDLIAHCPVCGKPMGLNLRSDDTFVQDDGWYAAAKRCDVFINDHQEKRIVYLEIGVGYNTPGIIKYPFMRLTRSNPKASYICITYDDGCIPTEIEDRSVLIEGDADRIIKALQS